MMAAFRTVGEVLRALLLLFACLALLVGEWQPGAATLGLLDGLALAHALGMPPEAVGVLLVRLGEELRQGRVQALAVELHEGWRQEGGPHG